jgi:hypothetical protein
MPVPLKGLLEWIEVAWHCWHNQGCLAVNRFS